MNIHDLLLKPGRLPRKQLSELGNALEPQLVRAQRHRLSEPRGKFNIVKINKNKLPLDFFPKKEVFSRRESSNKLFFPLEFTEPVRLQKKIDSQRKHYSPERTSCFGSQEDLESQSSLRINGGARFLNRKFETRQEPKRDIYALEPTRKLNTAAKAHKNEVLELYPSNYDPQLHELLAASSRTQNFRSPTKKDISSKLRENLFLQDPQTSIEGQSSLMLKQGGSHALGKGGNNPNVSMEQNSGEAMNITFYNAKSSCFPPINRGNGKQL